MDANHFTSAYFVGTLLDKKRIRVNAQGNRFLMFSIRIRDSEGGHLVQHAVAWNQDADRIALKCKRGDEVALAGYLQVYGREKAQVALVVDALLDVSRSPRPRSPRSCSNLVHLIGTVAAVETLKYPDGANVISMWIDVGPTTDDIFSVHFCGFGDERHKIRPGDVLSASGSLDHVTLQLDDGPQRLSTIQTCNIRIVASAGEHRTVSAAQLLH